jgi:hypothetical protein
MLLILPALAREVSDELSKYGKFEVTLSDNGSCKISLNSPTQGKVELIALEDCISVSANERLGTALFPAVTADGTEFHIFSISSLATMGNACGSDELDLFIVLAPNKAWELFASGYCRSLEEASLSTTANGPTLVLKQSPSSTSEGLLMEVWMGGSSEKTLPKLAHTVLSSKAQTLIGTLSSPIHATQYKPYIEVAGEFIPIEEASCKLEPYYEQLVELSIRQELLKDGTTENICTSVKRKGTP